MLSESNAEGAIWPPERKIPRRRAISIRSGGQRRKRRSDKIFLPIHPENAPAEANISGEKRSLLDKGSFVRRISMEERSSTERKERRQMQKPIKIVL